MIVNVQNNTRRNSVNVDSATTLRQTITVAGLDPNSGVWNLNGTSLMPADLDKTFNEFPPATNYFLMGVVKVDNA